MRVPYRPQEGRRRRPIETENEVLYMKNWKRTLTGLLTALLLTGCASSAQLPDEDLPGLAAVELSGGMVDLGPELVALAAAPALPEEPAPATEEGVLPDIGDPFADDGP